MQIVVKNKTELQQHCSNIDGNIVNILAGIQIMSMRVTTMRDKGVEALP